jgi:hypothetical protein
MSDPLYGSLRRRAEAARHLRPLACGCRDPLDCNCWPPLTDRPPPTERMVDGAVNAAKHLRAANLPPLFDLPTLRAMHKRGGDDRQLAQELFELAGEA